VASRGKRKRGHGVVLTFFGNLSGQDSNHFLTREVRDGKEVRGGVWVADELWLDLMAPAELGGGVDAG
jgi:hypothetical protein